MVKDNAYKLGHMPTYMDLRAHHRLGPGRCLAVSDADSVLPAVSNDDVITELSVRQFDWWIRWLTSMEIRAD